jgi:hypothetical protein
VVIYAADHPPAHVRIQLRFEAEVAKRAASKDLAAIKLLNPKAA